MLSPHKGRKYFLSSRGVMAIEFAQNKKICEGGNNEGRKKLVLLSFAEEQIGGA